MSNVGDAITALENLGLTAYEAQYFVALAQLPQGTAKEISQVADVPRSRVYETMDRLQNRGLVELHQANPRAYQSVSVDTALRTFRAQYDSYLETLDSSLRTLEPDFQQTVQGVWAINSHEQVTGRIVDLISEASNEIVLIVLDENVFDTDTVEALVEADSRAVTIYIGTTVESVRDRITTAGIDAQLFATELIEWFTAMSDAPRMGRLLMVDRGPVLVSALHKETLPGIPNETAAWSDGINHGFATFAERVFTYDLQQNLEDISELADTE
jgi:sugar-specific transcriptional regulator TrmB